MIDVIRAGRINSVQDLGRSGYRHLGICQAGALDRMALVIANKLVGNATDAAALEMTLGPCVLRFTADTRIAVGGADFAATLDGRSVAPWWSIPVAAGQTLTLAGARHGMRAYVAIAGGIDAAIQLGSRATDISAGFGGHLGRPIIEGDQLPIGMRDPSPRTDRIRSAPRFGVRAPDWYDLAWGSPESDTLPGAISGGALAGAQPMPIRVIPGPEYDAFTAAAQSAFWSDPWILTPQSNRMGFRLAGPELKIRKSIDMLSHGVFPGVIQVPPAGQPIILMADAQTTGGYPKIGVVIDADIPRLAQLRFNRALRFVKCDIKQAQQERVDARLFLEQIDLAMTWLGPAKK
ncbi:5-oxoprolinase subunit C family protein [Glaciimonas immobilis]|uniref:Biotin-dependent carboxylase-like uncharacterized protein n=1 Tax=Glaciimonas immobilis TaxID=728004 RepID=A0A840RNV8_9BURK|nr:biotin-dependent carboxyltransferase family protein [Glaciimonas immobilis]KAF3997176.1 biotin-dependent carboxyltransferase family protein [Glaciimonas immobilis]MBB5200047.1 biotin-dependent carboxylase-like uncharacterized protein [Glaciimonas immobilis]